MDEDIEFGEWVIQEKLCTREQVDECLAELRRNHQIGLGELLTRKGYLAQPSAPTMKLEGTAHAPRKPDIPAEAQGGKPFGPYLRTKLLGAGGMGEVWKAWDTTIGRWVALKLLKHDDPDEAARFRREAQTAGQLDHPNIARVYDVGEIDGRPYITMQFIDGRTILDHQADPREFAALVRDAALAVHAAHEIGIIHRDLKPQNLMVERGRVYVLDFGLAKQMSVDASISATGTVLGTPAYMPPEQARAQRADERSDVYGLGATLYHLLAGRAPIPGEGTYEVLKNVEEFEPLPPGGDPDLETIVMRCLEKQPERRFASALELADDLTRWLDGEAILSHAPSLTYKMRKFVSRRRSMTGVAISTVAVLVAIGVIVVPGLVRERRGRKRSEAALAERLEKERADASARERAMGRVETGRLKLQQIAFLRQKREAGLPEIHALSREADADFRAALPFPEAMLGLGLSALVRGDVQAALDRFNEAILAAPDFSPPYLHRQRIKLMQYDDLRHEIGGVVRDESEQSAALLREIEADMKVVLRASRERKEHLSVEAMIAFANGNYDASQRLLAEYLQIVPSDPEILLLRGHALFHLDRWEEADADLSRAIDLDVFLWEAHFHRAACRLIRNRLKEALADYDRVLELHPDYWPAWVQRSRTKYNLDDLDGAIDDARTAIRKFPQSPHGHAQLSLPLIQKAQYQEAFDVLNEAIRLKPDYGIAYHNRGLCHQHLGRLRQAIDDYDVAIKHLPTFVDSFTMRGICKLQLEDYEGALPDLNRAVELDPKNLQARFNRATILGMNGQFDQAVDDLNVILRDHPRLTDAWFNRGVTHFHRREWRDCERDMSEVLRQRKDRDPNAFLYRAIARIEVREYWDALEDLKACDALRPNWSAVEFYRAVALENTGDRKGAVAAAKRAIELGLEPESEALMRKLLERE